VPEETITLEPGPLTFPVTMMDELRKLGMVVEAGDSTLVLRTPITIAQKGFPLTPEQAKILVKFDQRIINFKVSLDCSWENGQFNEFK